MVNESRTGTAERIIQENPYMWFILCFGLCWFVLNYSIQRLQQQVHIEPLIRHEEVLLQHTLCGEVLTRAEIPQHLLFCPAKKEAVPTD